MRNTIYRLRSNQTSKLRVTSTIKKKRVEVGQTAWNGRIIQFDNNNLYPNLLDLYIANSSYASTVINVMRNFVYGNGFEDVNLNNTIFYNELGLILSGKQLLADVIKDYCKFGTFAAHVKYNILGQPASIKPLQSKYCRLTTPCEDGEIKEIAYFDNWENFGGDLYMKEPLFLPVFNPDNVLQEFEDVGFENHKGHIYMYKSGYGTYQESIWDSVISQIQTDVEVSNFRFRLVQNGLNATHLLAIPHLQDEVQLRELNAKINNAQGSDNAGSVIVIDGVGKDSVPSLLALDSKNHDKMYTIIDDSTKNAIRRVLNVPPVLVGDLVSGKLGTSQEIVEAEQYFEKNTERFRVDIEEGLYDILSKFYIPFQNIKIARRYGTN